MATFLIFSAYNLHSQTREDPRPNSIFHTFVNQPGEEQDFTYSTWCYEGSSGLLLNCAFHTAIRFEFPSTATTEKAKVDWGRGHVHTNNRPIGTVRSDMDPGGDGKSVTGFTGTHNKRIIHNYSALIPGAVTQKVRLQILQPQPTPNNPGGGWYFLQENDWLYDLKDPTHSTIEKPIAIIAEFPINPLTKVGDGAHYYTCTGLGCKEDVAHPEQLWGIEYLSGLIDSITTKYDALYFVTYSKHATAFVSRVSLQYGGIFDTNLTWTDSEPTHRFGKGFDISTLFVDATVDHIDKDTLDRVQEDLAGYAGFTYLPPSSNHPSYHFE